MDEGRKRALLGCPAAGGGLASKMKLSHPLD